MESAARVFPQHSSLANSFIHPCKTGPSLSLELTGSARSAGQWAQGSARLLPTSSVIWLNCRRHTGLHGCWREFWTQALLLVWDTDGAILPAPKSSFCRICLLLSNNKDKILSLNLHKVQNKQLLLEGSDPSLPLAFPQWTDCLSAGCDGEILKS